MDQQEGSTVPPSESRVADVLGGIGLYFVFLGLIQFLWVEHAEMASQARGWILTGLTSLGLFGSLGLLGPGKDGLPRAPRTANSLGILSWITLLLGLLEFGRAYHLPPSNLSGLAIGLVALWAGQSLESGLLGFAGASMLHGHLNEALGLRVGLAGSFATTHIFLGMALAALFVALGVWKERKGFRTEGVCLAAYGSLYLVTGIFLLSRFGELYHGVPESAWISHAYLLLLLVVCVLLLAVARGLQSGALAVIPTLALYLRALQSYAEWRGQVPETGVYLSLGFLLMMLAFRSEEKHPDLEGPRPQPLNRQLRLLRQAGVVALVLLTTAAIRGGLNSSRLEGEIRIPLECQYLPPLVLLDIEPFAIEYPHGAASGQELDVYLQTWKIEAGSALVQFGRCMATLPGAGIPKALKPERCFRVPGRMIRCRLFNGFPVEFVVPRARSLFELPRELWEQATEGHDLSFRIGKLGFPVPGELVPVPDPEPKPGG